MGSFKINTLCIHIANLLDYITVDLLLFDILLHPFKESKNKKVCPVNSE